jgi:hypothetical protein
MPFAMLRKCRLCAFEGDEAVKPLLYFGVILS